MSDPAFETAAHYFVRMKHKQFCQDFFGKRAEAVFKASDTLESLTTIGPIQCLDICMQMEAEHPNKIEEIMERAQEHPGDIMQGLLDYNLYLRKL